MGDSCREQDPNFNRTFNPFIINKKYHSFKTHSVYLPDANGVYHLVPNFADAWIDPATGTINTNIDPSAVDPMPFPFPLGSYHGYDYQFYYANLMQNTLTRSLTFLNRPQAVLYPSSLRTGVHATRAFQSVIPSFRDKLPVAPVAALASPTCNNIPKLDIFASPFGGWMKQKMHGGHAGYDIDGGGVAVGATKSWDALTLGLAAGYSRQRTTMSGMDGRVDADMLHTALFAGVDLGNIFIEGIAGYGRSWNDARRSLSYGAFDTFSYASHFRQNIWSASVTAGYNVELPLQWRLTSSVALDAVWVRAGEKRESGALASLHMEKSRYTSVELPISLMLEKRVTRAGKTLAPWIEAAWIPELGDRRPTATMRFTGNSAAGSFRTSVAAARSRGRVAAGLRGEVGSVSLNVGYTFEFSGSHSNHALNASIGMAF